MCQTYNYRCEMGQVVVLILTVTEVCCTGVMVTDTGVCHYQVPGDSGVR